MTPAPGHEMFTVGGGCFWSVQLAYDREPGVTKTEVGYSQGPRRAGETAVERARGALVASPAPRRRAATAQLADARPARLDY